MAKLTVKDVELKGKKSSCSCGLQRAFERWRYH